MLLYPMPPCPEPDCAPKVPSYLDSAPYILLLDFFMFLLKLILLEYLVSLILHLTNNVLILEGSFDIQVHFDDMPSQRDKGSLCEVQ